MAALNGLRRRKEMTEMNVTNTAELILNLTKRSGAVRSDRQRRVGLQSGQNLNV